MSDASKSESPHRGPRSISDADIQAISKLLGVSVPEDKMRDFFLIAAEAINRRVVQARVEPSVQLLRKALATVQTSAFCILDALSSPDVVELLLTTNTGPFGAPTHRRPLSNIQLLREELEALGETAQGAASRLKRSKGGAPAYERANVLSQGGICALIIMEADRRYVALSQPLGRRRRTPIHSLRLHEAAERLWLATGNPPRSKEEGNMEYWRRSFEAARGASNFWKHWINTVPPR